MFRAPLATSGFRISTRVRLTGYSKCTTLIYAGSKLGHQRRVLPTWQIEMLAPSYPQPRASLLSAVFMRYEPAHSQHPVTADETEARCLPPQMALIFTGQSPPPSKGLWTDGESQVRPLPVQSILII